MLLNFMRARILFLASILVVLAGMAFAGPVEQAIALEVDACCPGCVCVITPTGGHGTPPLKNPNYFCNSGTWGCEYCCDWCTNQGVDKIVGYHACTQYCEIPAGDVREVCYEEDPKPPPQD